jgi:hypothetical protein
MEKEPPMSKIKACLVGEEQNGKSLLASTGRKPILFHDFDDKREALIGIPGVYVITYKDPQPPKQPEAANEFLSVIAKLEDNLELRSLGFKDAPVGLCVKTNVVDSINTYSRAVGNYALFTSPALRREVTFGGHKIFVQQSWEAWGAEMKEVENQVLRLLALPTDTIITLHETMEEAEDSTPEKKKFTGKIGVYPARYQLLLKYFPELWRVKLTQCSIAGKAKYLPRVYPKPNYEFSSGTTMQLDEMEEPDICKMIAKHEMKLKALSATAPKELVGIK